MPAPVFSQVVETTDALADLLSRRPRRDERPGARVEDRRFRSSFLPKHVRDLADARRPYIIFGPDSRPYWSLGGGRFVPGLPEIRGGDTDTATTVGPAQPQTTMQPPGGPFVRHSEPGKARIWDLTGQSFGSLINTPLVSVPGYAARFRLLIKATGGANGNSTAVAGDADSPDNVIQLMTLWDAVGTPAYSMPGFEGLRLVPMLSGGFGLGPAADVHTLPSFSAIAGGTTGTGNFTLASVIPLEFAKGYGVWGMADGDVLPKLQIQLAPSSSVYTTPPPTLPTLEVRLNCDYYWLPAADSVEPPGLGSSRQWFLQQGNQSIGSAATTSVTIPRTGGWLDTLAFVLRDSSSQRIDAYPSIFRFQVDGIGEISTNLDEIEDDMAITWGIGLASPFPARLTGVIGISRKTSLGLQILGLLDTYETAMSTSPGTSLVIEGAPWGAVANAPATLNAVLGQVIPSDTLIQGLPEV
ncbi:MAG: hypothetical protein M0Z69_12350 [Actinomycetota bacterium]|nr:hypothetical protein [Actinomycetota bacterium]